MKSFYITTPIFYPNANLHMGHAYSTTLADIIARYHRIKGEEVYFLTGADENTEKVVLAAKIAEKTTTEYLDGIVSNFKDLFKKLDISYDQFIRTSDQKRHWPGAQELWNRITNAGDLEKRIYKGLYCIGHEAFITEKDLVDGKCPDHNEKPQTLEEENWFFKLSKYGNVIKEKIESGELEILDNGRKTEILAFLARGLEDISFSRSVDKVSVGIPIPGDLTQKMYVWCDALSNYVTALGFGTSDMNLYDKFWPANVHIIGKDILRFHALIWPAMLLSAGLPLPKTLLVHGFITSGGRKMSKSLGNVIDPNELINMYGAEAVRYYLARHISSFEDSDLTYQTFKEHYNANLANGLGNLTSRILKMSVSNSIKIEIKNKKDFQSDFNMEKYDVKSYCDEIWKKIAELDKSIQKNEPFKTIKTDKKKGGDQIKALLEDLFEIACKLEPIMPETSKTIQTLTLENKMPEKPLFVRKE